MAHLGAIEGHIYTTDGTQGLFNTTIKSRRRAVVVAITATDKPDDARLEPVVEVGTASTRRRQRSRATDHSDATVHALRTRHRSSSTGSTNTARSSALNSVSVHYSLDNVHRRRSSCASSSRRTMLNRSSN